MGKGKIKKNVGIISDDIVEKYKLYDYRGAKIIQALDLYVHVAKHEQNPYFVYHDPHRNSLLYFKEIEEDVCVVVKLKLRENKDCYVATVYPINKYKINKYKELSYIANR